MATWSFIEYLNSPGYTPWARASWSQYSVALIAGDTLSVRTIYNGGDSGATSVNYITAPNSSTTINDPDPTTSDTGLDKTWTSSSFNNTNHATRWYWFTAGVATGNEAQASIRVLTIPSTFGWSGVQSNIEQGTSGNAVLTIPSTFEAYIQGTASETGENLSTNGSKQERFHWRIVGSASSHTTVNAGFAASSGDFVGPDSGDFVSISPGFSTPGGVYYIKLYFYDYNGNTGTASTLIDVVGFNVTTAAALDTNISLTNSTFTISETATSYSGNTMTGGGTNTIYYVLNVSNFANGSNIDALRQNNDSRYIARTFSNSTGTRTFETIQSAGTIVNDLPSTGTFKTYYLYAANGNGLNSTRLTTGSTEYTVGRADTSITLTPSTTSLTATSTSNVTVNVTGDTSGTQYRLYTNNINRWVSTYNGGGSSTTDFTISYDEAPGGGAGTGVTELPGIGQTFTYFSQARVLNQSADWINTNDSFTITRASAATYSVSSPSTVNEGSTLTFSVTTTNVVNGTTVAWTLSGLNSGDYYMSYAGNPITINNNSGTATFNIVADNVADGNKTATLTLASTDSAGASTGSPSSSTTVLDTSNPGGGGGTGGGTGGSTANTYGLQILNSGGTQVIIDDTSRLTNFLATDSINTNTQSSKTMFTNFDCSDKTETGILVTWSGALYSSPTVTRRSSALGGITVTKNGNDTSSSTAGIATIELVRY